MRDDATMNQTPSRRLALPNNAQSFHFIAKQYMLQRPMQESRWYPQLASPCSEAGEMAVASDMPVRRPCLHLAGPEWIRPAQGGKQAFYTQHYTSAEANRKQVSLPLSKRKYA